MTTLKGNNAKGRNFSLTREQISIESIALDVDSDVVSSSHAMMLRSLPTDAIE